MNLQEELPAVSAVETVSMSADVASEIPQPPFKLSIEEKKIWQHVTVALNEYQLIHLTDSLTLSVICKSFAAWTAAEKHLARYMKENAGSMLVKTPNGFEQPHQLFYVARQLKKELLQWLPEAALTIPSFQKVMGERVVPQQRTLFDDPVTRHRKNKTIIGLVALDGGKK